MAAESAYAGPAEALELYEEVVAGNPEVERKGAKMPYTSRNGNSFSFLDANGLMALRLPDELREEFHTEYRTDLVEQYGRVMAEYVTIPDGLLRDTTELQAWFDRSYEWVGTLDPKPTKR